MLLLFCTGNSFRFRHAGGEGNRCKTRSDELDSFNGRCMRMILTEGLNDAVKSAGCAHDFDLESVFLCRMH